MIPPPSYLKTGTPRALLLLLLLLLLPTAACFPLPFFLWRPPSASPNVVSFKPCRPPCKQQTHGCVPSSPCVYADERPPARSLIFPSSFPPLGFVFHRAGWVRRPPPLPSPFSRRDSVVCTLRCLCAFETSDFSYLLPLAEGFGLGMMIALHHRPARAARRLSRSSARSRSTRRQLSGAPETVRALRRCVRPPPPCVSASQEQQATERIRGDTSKASTGNETRRGRNQAAWTSHRRQAPPKAPLLGDPSWNG